jgi:hypothetical protein
MDSSECNSRDPGALVSSILFLTNLRHSQGDIHFLGLGLGAVSALGFAGCHCPERRGARVNSKAFTLGSRSRCGHSLTVTSLSLPNFQGSRTAVTLNMNALSEGRTAFGISIGLAFIGGYADAASFVLAHTFTGHLIGNCVLATVSAASKEWNLAADRLLAIMVFLMGILASLTLSRFIPISAAMPENCAAFWRGDFKDSLF